MKRNINLLITAIETVILGFVLIFNHPDFDDPHRPILHMIDAFCSWPACAFLLVLGGGALALTIGNYHKHYADFSANVIMGALWMAYFVAFLVQDAFSKLSLSVDTVMIGFVVIRIFIDAFRNYQRGEWIGG